MIETTKDFFQKAGIFACPFFQILQSFYINISHIWKLTAETEPEIVFLLS